MRIEWQTYTVHNYKEIKGFFGDYRWLSNFHKCNCYYDGVLYPSSENAFQAAKVQSDQRTPLLHCSAAESKKLWKTLPKLEETAEQWDARKYEVMTVILLNKFTINKDLRLKLVETRSKYLEETNAWKDTYWGVDINLGGQNNLGKILMKIRDFWK